MGNCASRVVMLIALGSAVACFSVAAQESTESVWKIREADFIYRSTVTIYSCSALQARVANIMRAVGARDDVAVTVTSCDSGFVPPESSHTTSDNWGRSGTSTERGILSSRLTSRVDAREQQAHVRVRALMPVPVTPQVLAELEKDKSRRELVSRMTGNPAAMYDNPVAFPARRQEVTLSQRTIGLEAAECQLLEQMSSSIFRRLDVRIVRRSFSCDRNGTSRIAPRLTVEALMWAATGAGARLPQMPSAGDTRDDADAPGSPEDTPGDTATVTPPG